MAGSIRAIKDRINSVGSMKQITHAMELVSSAKFRRTREKADARKAYTAYIISSIRTIAEAAESPNNIYLRNNKSNKSLYIVITADKGLCGGFNSNLLRFAQAEINKAESAAVIAVGTKSMEYFNRRKTEVVGTYSGSSENPTFEFAQDIAGTAMGLFRAGVVNDVYVIYNRFKSVLVQAPAMEKLLPLTREDIYNPEDRIDSFGFELPVSTVPKAGQPGMVMTFEPGPGELLKQLIPRYFTNAVYGALIENSAGEQAARKTAMESATDNAQEMIDSLSLKYNRARQSQITNELTDIINGADAIG